MPNLPRAIRATISDTMNKKLKVSDENGWHRDWSDINRLPVTLAAVFCLVMYVFAAIGQSVDTRSILNGVITKTDAINRVSYRLSYRERVYENGKMRTGSSDIRYQKSPRRVYIKTDNGTELLWGPDMNEGDVLVHPPSFPYFNLNLNPDGYWMRKDQHHGIEDVGFDYVSSLLKAAIIRAGDNFSSHFLYKGELTYGSAACYEIDIVAIDFGYKPYVVKKGETVITIARSHSLNEYMTLKHNPQISSYSDVKAGQSLLLPSDFAPRVILYIDKQTLFPVLLRVEDEKGVFEEYVYQDVNVNPNFNPNEFTKDCKDYRF